MLILPFAKKRGRNIERAGKAPRGTDQNKWSGRVLMRYTLFQLPALCVIILALLFLRQWLDIPVWIILLFTILWVAKDAAMYPVVWRAYDDRASDHMKSFIGMLGIVRQRLSPTGHVLVQGELWRAETKNEDHPIDKDVEVRVIEVSGLTLIVEPVHKKTSEKIE